jgi:hypothetical protein
MEVVITSGLRVEAPVTCGYSLPVNGRNGDTLIGCLGQAALRRDQCDIFAQSKIFEARETAIGR